MAEATLFEKIWAQHEVAGLPGGASLLHVDRHLIHDLEAGPGLRRLSERGLKVARPDLTFATPDHALASAPGAQADPSSKGGLLLRDMRTLGSAAGIRVFDVGKPGQGIVHVMGPELGITLPGTLIVCPDSHTCTHGGLGALAFGIGSSEVLHVLATQTIRQTRPQTMRIRFDGALGAGVTAKDMILHAIGVVGTAGGRGYAVEYAGETVRALSVESRLTLCNLSIELGAKIGMVAPDDTAFEFVANRPYAPQGAAFAQAVAAWRALAGDQAARFDKDVSIDAAAIAPQVTWGTSPEQVAPVTDAVPGPPASASAEARRAHMAALDYMGLEPGQRLAGTPVDWVFIGSCANSRLPDLRDAARIVSGRKVAPGVRAWVIAGSENTRREAEAEGLDRVFIEAGFEWRAPSCSLCLGANGDFVPPGQRCISTSNRNFVGRQGPGARTHLASPATAAASAIAGVIADPRTVAS